MKINFLLVLLLYFLVILESKPKWGWDQYMSTYIADADASKLIDKSDSLVGKFARTIVNDNVYVSIALIKSRLMKFPRTLSSSFKNACPSFNSISSG